MFGINFGSGEMHTTSQGSYIEDQTEYRESAVGADPYYGIAKSVLEGIGQEATNHKPGTIINFPLPDAAINVPTIELVDTLKMEADKFNVLLVELGETAVSMQVCKPSAAPSNAEE